MEIENTTNVEMEQQATDQYDAFMSGWDGESPETEQPADQQVEQAEGQARDAVTEDVAETDAGAEGEAESAQSETTDEGAESEPEAKKTEQTAPQSWKIKHMGAEKVLGVSDITPELLQKGIDYDRVRAKYDEAKPVMEMFGEFAKTAGLSVADYVRHIRAEAKRAGGLSEAEAKREVELEDREAAVAVKEADRQKDADAEAAQQARITKDLEDFAKAFPDVYERAKSDPREIPQSVWDEVNGGALSLTAAYSRYAVAKAQSETKAANDRAAASQNQKNAERATGSMKSAGNDTRNTDAFLEGFDS